MKLFLCLTTFMFSLLVTTPVVVMADTTNAREILCLKSDGSQVKLDPVFLMGNRLDQKVCEQIRQYPELYTPQVRCEKCLKEGFGYQAAQRVYDRIKDLREVENFVQLRNLIAATAPLTDGLTQYRQAMLGDFLQNSNGDRQIAGRNLKQCIGLVRQSFLSPDLLSNVVLDPRQQSLAERSGSMVTKFLQEFETMIDTNPRLFEGISYTERTDSEESQWQQVVSRVNMTRADLQACEKFRTGIIETHVSRVNELYNSYNDLYQAVISDTRAESLIMSLGPEQVGRIAERIHNNLGFLTELPEEQAEIIFKFLGIEGVSDAQLEDSLFCQKTGFMEGEVDTLASSIRDFPAAINEDRLIQSYARVIAGETPVPASELIQGTPTDDSGSVQELAEFMQTNLENRRRLVCGYERTLDELSTAARSGGAIESAEWRSTLEAKNRVIEAMRASKAELEGRIPAEWNIPGSRGAETKRHFYDRFRIADIERILDGGPCQRPVVRPVADREPASDGSIGGPSGDVDSAVDDYLGTGDVVYTNDPKSGGGGSNIFYGRDRRVVEALSEVGEVKGYLTEGMEISEAPIERRIAGPLTPDNEPDSLFDDFFPDLTSGSDGNEASFQPDIFQSDVTASPEAYQADLTLPGEFKANEIPATELPAVLPENESAESKAMRQRIAELEKGLLEERKRRLELEQERLASENRALQENNAADPEAIAEELARSGPQARGLPTDVAPAATGQTPKKNSVASETRDRGEESRREVDALSAGDEILAEGFDTPGAAANYREPAAIRALGPLDQTALFQNTPLYRLSLENLGDEVSATETLGLGYPLISITDASYDGFTDQEKKQYLINYIQTNGTIDLKSRQLVTVIVKSPSGVLEVLNVSPENSQSGSAPENIAVRVEQTQQELDQAVARHEALKRILSQAEAL